MSNPTLTPPDSTPSTPIRSKTHREQPLPSTSTSLSISSSSTSSKTVLSKLPLTKSYRNTLLSYADSLTSGLTSSLLYLSSPPIVSACRFAIVKAMGSTISGGHLRIISESEGRVYNFPTDEKERTGETMVVRVIKDSFWIRLVALGDLGFAEAYMAGECEVGDLVGVFKIFIHSHKPQPSSATISGIATLPSTLISLVTSLTNSRFANTLSNSISNIRAHYDLSNGMFESFLSADMTYSCGIYPELDADLRLGQGYRRLGGRDGVDELEQAQLAKIRYIIKKADIRPGMRVLEIGSGWGSFSIEAVKSTGCTVDTLTLSTQQKALAEERIKAAGLAGRIRVWLMDYRALPESWKGAFDRVVSIEMLEAVGKEFIPGYFGMIDSALNERGVACIQVITIPESRFDSYQREVDFIRKWIFPGGFLPTVSYVTESIHKGGKNRLVIDSISNIGPHYARTLREWSDRFSASFSSRIAPALLEEHPEMDLEDIEVFRRKWIYYFAYCEVGFTERVIGDHIFTMVREGYADYGCEVFA